MQLIKIFLKVILIVAFGITTFYFLLQPIIPICYQITTFSGLSTKDYYNILSYIYGIGTSIVALILGYLYYIGKIENDQYVKNQDRKILRKQYIFSELEKINDNVLLYYHQNKINQAITQSKIISSLDHINLLLELNAELLNYDEKELDAFIKLNSFVEKQIIYNGDKTLQKKDKLEIYRGLHSEAMKVCHLSSK
jgi:hypothetical protein